MYDDRTLTKLYIEDVKHNVLTYEQEQALCWAIVRGRETNDTALLGAAKVARNQLISNNLLLVVSIAGSHRGYGIPMPDLIQEGNVGLVRAVDKFDPSRGFRLSTYASWWILQGVTRAVANGARTIRLPVHIFERRRICRRLYNAYLVEHGEAPTTAQLAELMNQRVSSYATERPETIEMLMALGDIASLDAPLQARGDLDGLGPLTLADLAIAEEVPSTLENQDLARDLNEVLELLSPREARILELRYGLKDGRSRTFKEIGRMYGLTRERIRQIEAAAFERLRTYQQLRKWLEDAA